MKKSLFYILALLTLLTGCSQVTTFLPDGSEIDITSSTTDSETDTPPQSFDEVKADYQKLETVAFSQKLEAEAGAAKGEIALSQVRKGYSGTGYMTGFSANLDNSYQITAKLPSSQLYDITIVVASEKAERNTISINSTQDFEILTKGAVGFEKITLRNVYIEKGLVVLTLKEITGGIDLDYFEIKSNTEATNLKFSVNPTPVNTNASQRTKDTLKFISDNFCKKTISGQYATMGTNAELDMIYKTTGKYPAIRFGDLMPYTSSSYKGIKEIEQAEKWAEKGGLVGYVWHWEAPVKEPSYYSDQTSFDITMAVSKTNIALLSIDEIEKMYDKGEISKECLEIVKDIDRVSEQLSRLKDKNITVMWRPLHEASGGWFWWGKGGKESYKWLYKLLFERQTYYHKLDNLIWVWNAQNPDWYVGDEMCDIISADIYSTGKPDSSQVNTFLELANISKNKIIALSECETVPDVNNMLRDKALWSYFAIWNGSYIMDTQGNFSSAFTSLEKLIRTYNHENVITLDKLPKLS